MDALGQHFVCDAEVQAVYRYGQSVNITSPDFDIMVSALSRYLQQAQTYFVLLGNTTCAALRAAMHVHLLLLHLTSRLPCT